MKKVILMVLNKSCRKRGALSLEIAIAAPVVMIVLLSFVWQISAIRNEVIYRSIFIKECEKASLMGISLELLGMSSTAEALSQEFGDITEVLLDKTYQVALYKNIEAHYHTFLANKRGFTPILKPEYTFAERDASGDILYFTTVYSLYTPFGKQTKFYTIPLRTWYRGDFSGKIGRGSNKNVWDMDNFERGKFVRVRFGGNLPLGFPVLSGFSDGNALVIRSMDLTKPSWSDPVQVLMQLRSEITELIQFEGTDNPWGKNSIKICNGDIIQRIFKLVIPENTEIVRYTSIFDDLSDFCRLNQVEFEVLYFQKSENRGE
ncbi:MAG: hypothetical protein ACYCYM_01155 [Saccharofermentanales bacterium]